MRIHEYKERLSNLNPDELDNVVAVAGDGRWTLVRPQAPGGRWSNFVGVMHRPPESGAPNVDTVSGGADLSDAVSSPERFREGFVQALRERFGDEIAQASVAGYIADGTPLTARAAQMAIHFAEDRETVHRTANEQRIEAFLQHTDWTDLLFAERDGQLPQEVASFVRQYVTMRSRESRAYLHGELSGETLAEAAAPVRSLCAALRGVSGMTDALLEKTLAHAAIMIEAGDAAVEVAAIQFAACCLFDAQFSDTDDGLPLAQMAAMAATEYSLPQLPESAVRHIVRVCSARLWNEVLRQDPAVPTVSVEGQFSDRVQRSRRATRQRDDAEHSGRHPGYEGQV